MTKQFTLPEKTASDLAMYQAMNAFMLSNNLEPKQFSTEHATMLSLFMDIHQPNCVVVKNDFALMPFISQIGDATEVVKMVKNLNKLTFMERGKKSFHLGERPIEYYQGWFEGRGVEGNMAIVLDIKQILSPAGLAFIIQNHKNNKIRLFVIADIWDKGEHLVKVLQHFESNIAFFCQDTYGMDDIREVADIFGHMKADCEDGNKRWGVTIVSPPYQDDSETCALRISFFNELPGADRIYNASKLITKAKENVG